MKLDVSTFNLTRPSTARILIERDITLPVVDEIWIGTAHNGYWQPVVMEQKLYYCGARRMFGHSEDKCFRVHPELRTIPPVHFDASPIQPDEDHAHNIVGRVYINNNSDIGRNTELNLNLETKEDDDRQIPGSTSQGGGLDCPIGETQLIELDRADIYTFHPSMPNKDLQQQETQDLQNTRVEELPFDTAYPDVPDIVLPSAEENNLQLIKDNLEEEWEIKKSRRMKKGSLELKKLMDDNLISEVTFVFVVSSAPDKSINGEKLPMTQDQHTKTCG
ncbi:uncharacterized protein LOC110038119 [Phalaenopsis equestris]|uniref:uncharacterized protein LOC110038119 n=1 Tax=Phalaenopsis equestris TaxID=78828 RepID=UPI0009E5C9A1|nr:uncharacterized protein LOC110038119 [Phalaenopsis equestris]